jgi:HK97 family phage prohead protease
MLNLCPALLINCGHTRCLSHVGTEGNADLILARVSAGTLQLSEDKKGLRFRAALPGTTYADDLVANIEAGNISECSFGFIARDEAWSKEADPDDEDGGLRQVRTLKDCDLVDVSTCTFPAYPGTGVGASSRSLWPQGMPAEVRSHVNRRAADDEQDGCDCDCAFCRAGECGDCSNEDCVDADCAGCPQQADSRGNRGAGDGEKVVQAAEDYFKSDASDADKQALWGKLSEAAIAAGIDTGDEDDERAARDRAVALASVSW